MERWSTLADDASRTTCLGTILQRVQSDPAHWASLKDGLVDGAFLTQVLEHTGGGQYQEALGLFLLHLVERLQAHPPAGSCVGTSALRTCDYGMGPFWVVRPDPRLLWRSLAIAIFDPTTCQVGQVCASISLPRRNLAPPEVPCAQGARRADIPTEPPCPHGRHPLFV